MNQIDFKQWLKKAKKSPQDILAVDLDPSGVRCVRLKKSGNEIHLLAMDILPPVDLTSVAPRAGTEKVMDIPKPLLARYVALCLTGEDAVVKLLTLPGQADNNLEAQIKDHMGIDEGDFRFGYQNVTAPGHVKSETKVLTVAIPDNLAHMACHLFPIGIPAPLSVELSGLSAINAFIQGPGQTVKNETVGVIEMGARVTFVAFFTRGELSLIRKFDFGQYAILDVIQKNLGVDQETARDIVADGSFDISGLVKDVSEPFVKQLVISKHFVERRENSHISQIFVPGGLGVSHDWLNEIKAAVSLDVDFWNPFDAVKLPAEGLPKQFEGQQSRFAAALGAALGNLISDESAM